MLLLLLLFFTSCRCSLCDRFICSLFSVFLFVFVLNKNVFIFVILNVCFGVCVSVVVGAAVLVGFVIAYNAIAIIVN